MKQEPTHNNPNHWGKSGADIVERLHKWVKAFADHPEAQSTFQEAADEIERLRERCEAYKGQVKCGSDEIKSLMAENHEFREEIVRQADEMERLRERCEACKGQVKCGSDEIERLKERVKEAENRQALAEIEHDRMQAELLLSGEPRGFAMVRNTSVTRPRAFQAGVDTGRRLALEEAARVAEAQAVKWESIGETNHAGVIADAIRALKCPHNTR